MKSPTKQYRVLKTALKKAELITGGVDKLGCKTELQHLKLQSYILLCHAALEQYLEDIGAAVALEARKIYSNSEIITKSLVALISSKLVDDLPGKSKIKICSDLATNIEEFSMEAYNRYRAVVRANNGIIKRDQNALLLPIGVDPADVDLVLMNSLNAFGAKRGDVAHKFKVHRTDTLTAVQTDISVILVGLIAYDEAACAALKQRLR